MSELIAGTRKSGDVIHRVGASNLDLITLVLAVSDTQMLARHADPVFLVARVEFAALGKLQESAKRLGQIGVTVKGGVFNDLDTSRQHYGGYCYHGCYRYTNYPYGTTASGQ